MFETAQPQAGETANQPGDIAVVPEAGYDTDAAEAQRINDVKGAAADGPFMTVRYNKEDKPLSYEEAIAYAQKGMNYDKLQARLKETTEKLTEYENGLSSAQEGNTGSTKSHETFCGGNSEELKQAIIDGQLESFMNSNPGIDPRELPESVISLWKKGVPLSEAYLMHQAEQLGMRIRDMEKAAAQEQANRANRAASMGSAASSGSTRGKQITEDAIRNMTPEELDRNHERIWAYLTKR